MPWNATQVASEILAIHAALIPTGSQGEVVLLGGDEHWSAQQETASPNGYKKTRLYDVASHTIVPGWSDSPQSDIFCGHHAFIGDGRLLMAGGTSEWPISGIGHDHHLNFFGHSRCWLFNPRQRVWVETTRLNRNPAQPDEPRSGGRWYPGLVALGDGSVVAFFGHLDRNDFRHRNIQPERFSPGSSSWTLYSELMANYGEPDADGRRFLFFARVFTLPNGKLFFVTPMPVDFAAVPGTEGAHFSTGWDPATGLYAAPKVVEPAGEGHDDWSRPAVLLPLLFPAYNARALWFLGASPVQIDIDAATPAWQPTGARDASVASRERKYGTAVLLPTGQVCIVGGVNVVEPEDPVLQTEIFTPDIDWATGTYGAGAGVWEVKESGINARNYHSTALLLPNGKVWVAGGDTNANSGDPDSDITVNGVVKKLGIKEIELYEPDYVAIPNRIQITGWPQFVTYAGTFDVTIDRPATQVARASLIRNGSVTHATDNDQRYVGLEIVQRTGNTVRLRAPAGGNVAPPGYYMLWLVDVAGQPSQLARFVRVAHVSCRLITDRSTFSQEEVQAMGGGTNALFSRAVYVDFDGYLAAELSATPAMALHWVDDGTPVPAAQLTLQFVARLDETSPPNPDVPGRTTFAFDALFGTMDAFNGWLDQREITVQATLGSQSCSGILDLTKSPNPYTIDVDPVRNNPFWLSTDVRVFSVSANNAKLGVTQHLGGTAPYDFIRDAVQNLRSGTAQFESLAPDGPGAQLELATGNTFNYAVARVRYRATVTTATHVQCFFRIFNVAATGLEFDQNTVYRRSPGPNAVPLLGVAGDQLASIPFFAGPRANTVTGQPSPAGVDAQTLTPLETADIAPAAGGTGAEVSMYFGCYLDINVPYPRFPIAPGLANGPFTAADARSIQELMRGKHSCIVAEIYFTPKPTRAGAGPGDSDNLAQRNLAILHSDNPGSPESHTVMHTFEVQPSAIGKAAQFLSTVSSLGVNGKRVLHADELWFDWHDLPRSSEVTLYFSDVDTSEITALSTARISPAAFTVLDASTIRFRIGDCAWLPIPGARAVRIPGLVAIKLPDNVVEGQKYHVSVRQVEGRTGRVIGAFEISIPISRASFIRSDEERTLSVMRHIASRIPQADRWAPIFDCYLGHLAAKVDALGGRSRDIEANPDGSGRPYVPSTWKPGDPFPPGGTGSRHEPAEDEDEREECRTPKAGCFVAVAIILAVVALVWWIRRDDD